jgi:UDP-perosamine 4-acetyltransferase
LVILGVCDPYLAAEDIKTWEGLNVLGAEDSITLPPPEMVQLILGVGQLPFSNARELLYDKWLSRGYEFPVLVHPNAWVSAEANLAKGVQVMAGAIVQPGSRIGQNTILNTRVGIDHDCDIGPHVHIAPGATLCGTVTVGSGAFIGAGATIIQGLRIGQHAVVGAGATLVHNLAPSKIVLPAINRQR